MLKKIQRRASRIRFIPKKIIIVLEIESCQFHNYEEQFNSTSAGAVAYSSSTPSVGIVTLIGSPTSTASNPEKPSLSTVINVTTGHTHCNSNTVTNSTSQPAAGPKQSPSITTSVNLNPFSHHPLSTFHAIQIPLGTMMCLSIEKGLKVYNTTEQELYYPIEPFFQMENPLHTPGVEGKEKKTAIVQWQHEIIESTGTLYYDPKTHRFQEKILTIKLKMKKKENGLLVAFSRDTLHHSIGRFTIPLHEIIHEQLIANNVIHNPTIGTTGGSHNFPEGNLPVPILTNLSNSLSSDGLPPDKRRLSNASGVSTHFTPAEETQENPFEGEEEDDDNFTEDGVENSSMVDVMAYDDEHTDAGHQASLAIMKQGHDGFSIPITSWNDIEQKIRLPLVEQSNITLNGRILIKFLPDYAPTDSHNRHSAAHKIDNYLPKFMLKHADDPYPERKQHFTQRKEATLMDEEEEEVVGEGCDVVSDDENEDNVSSLSSLTSSNHSPHPSRKKRALIKDIFTSSSASASSSFHNNGFAAAFPTHFFQKVKERLNTPKGTQIPRSGSVANEEFLLPSQRPSFHRQVSQESTESNDSSYGPDSYPQPRLYAVSAPPMLQKPKKVTILNATGENDHKSVSPNALSPANNSTRSKELTKEKEDYLESSASPRKGIELVWFHVRGVYLTLDGIGSLLFTIIALIIVCEYVRRNFMPNNPLSSN